MKSVAIGFGGLLKSIVDTIDRYGLKRHFSRKHQRGLIGSIDFWTPRILRVTRQ
jgi:hypothetical protein